ncbi:uncharacterized protein PAC_15797 [Phialocephala subalpina]|uniref:Uncharacterized protein n=1 Tax=Phialocephala subalpina TaxID=576137 RepID=A0A1L7XLS4_9HELO|nr:uncharacterized protein PAC_15797 [Phialocephala subalpina]
MSFPRHMFSNLQNIFMQKRKVATLTPQTSTPQQSYHTPPTHPQTRLSSTDSISESGSSSPWELVISDTTWEPILPDHDVGKRKKSVAEEQVDEIIAKLEIEQDRSKSAPGSENAEEKLSAQDKKLEHESKAEEQVDELIAKFEVEQEKSDVASRSEIAHEKVKVQNEQPNSGTSSPSPETTPLYQIVNLLRTTPSMPENKDLMNQLMMKEFVRVVREVQGKKDAAGWGIVVEGSGGDGDEVEVKAISYSMHIGEEEGGGEAVECILHYYLKLSYVFVIILNLLRKIQMEIGKPWSIDRILRELCVNGGYFSSLVDHGRLEMHSEYTLKSHVLAASVILETVILFVNQSKYDFIHYPGQPSFALTLKPTHRQRASSPGVLAMSKFTDDELSKQSEALLDKFFCQMKRAEEVRMSEQKMRVLDMQLAEDNIRGRLDVENMKIEYDAKVKKTLNEASNNQIMPMTNKRKSKMNRWSWA